VPSLGFDLLDRHVVHGRAEEVACSDSTGRLSYAELLGQVAALAGGLRAIGLGTGDEVEVRVGSGNLRVQVVCACIRLGAVPGERAEVRIVEGGAGATVHTVDDEFDLSLVLRVGKTDPAPSLAADPPGYRERVSGAFGDVIEALG
jgi:hypothetical protein